MKEDLFRTDLVWCFYLHQGLEKLIAIGRRDISEEVRGSAFQALQGNSKGVRADRFDKTRRKCEQTHQNFLALRTDREMSCKALAAMGLALCAAISDPLEPQGQFGMCDHLALFLWHSRFALVI